MENFDDRLSLLQILSRDMAPVNRSLPKDVEESYQYLLAQYLYTSYDKKRLEKRVIEVYFENMKDSGYDGEYNYSTNFEPDVFEISDMIDYENMEILRSYYKDYNYNDEDIDDVIIGYYIQSISYVLSDWVEEILLAQGYPVRRGLSSSMNESLDKFLLDRKHAPQNIMFYEFLY